MVLGTYNLWLVANTKRLWPAIALHFLYNFFVMSTVLYRSVWTSDEPALERSPNQPRDNLRFKIDTPTTGGRARGQPNLW